MTNEPYCFIVNPYAGGGRSRRNWARLKAELEREHIPHAIFQSELPGGSRQLARQAYAAGHRKFIAVGGDGTANGVLNGLLPEANGDRAEVTLGVMPWGTGNDWAAYYQLSPKVEDCLAVLREGFTRYQDIGKAAYTDDSGQTQDHYFLNCAGTGFDSFLLEKMGSARGSRLRYLWSLLKYYPAYKPADLLVEIDGRSRQHHALLLSACLGSFAGAGMNLAPAAIADDGLLDILAIDAISIPYLLRSLPYLYNGRIGTHPAASCARTNRVHIHGERSCHLHCDGEVVGTLPACIEILSWKLSVLTHR